MWNRGGKRTLLSGRQLHKTQTRNSSLKGWPPPSAVHWQRGRFWEWRKIRLGSNNILLHTRQVSCPEKEKSYIKQKYKISRWNIYESVIILRKERLKWNRYLPHGIKKNKANHCQLLKGLLKGCCSMTLPKLVSHESIPREKKSYER